MGVEPQRKIQLVEATIRAIGETGSLDVTVGQIAARAGVSPALAFHYFGDKERLFLSAMRHVLEVYGAEVRRALAAAPDPRARLEGVVRASFSTTSFDRGVIAAWLNFYVLAQRSPEAHRLLGVYHRRLQSNLVHALRPLADDAAPGIAQRLAAQIDGIYLRVCLDPDSQTAEPAVAALLAALDRELSVLQGAKPAAPAPRAD